MFCTKCGAKMKEGAAFCTNCGNKFPKREDVVFQDPDDFAPEVKPVSEPAFETITTQQEAMQPQAQQTVNYQQTPQQEAVQPQVQQTVNYQQAPQPMPQQAQQTAQSAPQSVYIQPQSVYEQQGYSAYNQQSQPVYAQQVQGQAQPPKKKNIGKILGLAIGIPMGVLTILGIAAVIIVPQIIKYYIKAQEAANIYGHSGNSGHDYDYDYDNDYDYDYDYDSDYYDDNDYDYDPWAYDDNDYGTDDGGNTGYEGYDSYGTEYSPAVVDENVYDESKDTRTLMIYLLGTDLETEDEDSYGGAATRDIYEICEAALPDKVNIVIECGGAKMWEHPDVPDGEVTRFKVENGELVKLQELGRTTMTKTGDLSDFILFAKEQCPANNYTLILWDHGGGIPVGFGCDELGDYYDTMCDYEIRNELAAARTKFDAVIFDACNMCTLEMARALDGYADYMVGAESYVNGTGIYYTNWLSKLDGDPRSFSEEIVQDYMDQNEIDGLIGSMSVIRLDYIPAVYEAYVNYMAESFDMLESGDYSNYYQARGNCGFYESNDSVDLITLATSYNNSYSTPLMNAVVNAVVYTESDFVYGHGLMAYSPYESYDEYSVGRESFVALGYDKSVLDFYDGFIARKLAYLGDEYVDDYGGGWYDGDYSNEVAEVETYASGGELPLIEKDGYYAVQLSDELWDSMYYISQAVLIELEDGDYFVLGEDYHYEIDDDYDVALVDPDAWVYINDSITTYFCVDYYEDEYTGGWAQTGIVPVTVNGKGAYLYIYYDNDNPSGVIEGYSLYNFDTDEESDDIYPVSMEDTIDLVYMYMDENFNVYYEEAGEPFNAEEIRLQYLETDFNDYSTLGYYDMYDVYGNEYSTEVAYLGSRSAIGY